MARTFRIIDSTVGKGGHQFGPNVLRVKQLLKLNGLMVTAGDHWDRTTETALLDFRQKLFGETPFAMVDSYRNEPLRASIPRNDMVLFELAYRANVLIRLCPPRSGADALTDVHDWLVKRETGFGWNRVAWGVEGMPTWAVVTSFEEDKPIAKQFYGFEFPSTEAPLALNCTVYANLMMSVWLHGNVHQPPFSAGVAESGLDKHLSVSRYGYKLLGEYKSVADITKHTAKNPSQLFCVEAGNFVGHMALLLDGEVFQCNIGKPACTRTPLERFVRGHPSGWISGPAPARP
jgi:hypothetical protein